MAVCAMEQVLRQRATSEIIDSFKSFLSIEKRSCCQMRERFNFIYDSVTKPDIRIGDLIPFETNSQKFISIPNRLRKSLEDGVYHLFIDNSHADVEE